MLWQIVNNIDTQKARDVPLFVRSPFIECQGLFSDSVLEELSKRPQDNVSDKVKALFYHTAP
jgi:hypothetical protein